MQHRAYRGEGECLEGTIALLPNGKTRVVNHIYRCRPFWEKE